MVRGLNAHEEWDCQGGRQGAGSGGRRPRVAGGNSSSVQNLDGTSGPSTPTTVAATSHATAMSLAAHVLAKRHGRASVSLAAHALARRPSHTSGPSFSATSHAFPACALATRPSHGTSGPSTAASSSRLLTALARGRSRSRSPPAWRPNVVWEDRGGVLALERRENAWRAQEEEARAWPIRRYAGETEAEFEVRQACMRRVRAWAWERTRRAEGLLEFAEGGWGEGGGRPP